MDYQQKYLKYKEKYLNLKNKINYTGGFQLTIKNMYNPPDINNPTNIFVIVELTDTILQIKQKIFDQKQFVINDQCLSLPPAPGLEMENNKTLIDYNINQGSIIYLSNLVPYIPYPPDNFQLFIQKLTGSTTTIGVQSSDTILSVKQKIENKVDIPVSNQRLILNGEKFVVTLSDNNKTLTDYNINRNNNKIYVKNF